MGTEIATRDTKLETRIYRAERELNTPADAETCQQVAEMIIGSYPNANPGDPVTYTRALRALLGGYPASVVAAIANPRSGIVTQCRFPPTMAEIQEYAQPMVERMQASLHRDRETMKQLEHREQGVTQEERERMGNRLKDLANEMRGQTDRDEESRRQETAERFRRTQCAEGEAIRAHMGLDDDDPDYGEANYG